MTRTPAITVALFDLDDTLFDHRGAVVRGILAHRRSLGGEVAAADDELENTRWYDLEESEYHRYLTGEFDFLGQRRSRARGYMAPFGVALSDDEALAWFDTYLGRYQESWALHADALPCLDALTSRSDPVRIGLITNGDVAFQTAKQTATGLLPHIEHMIASGEFGIAKPDPRIFLHACEVFDVEPARAAYVGDRLRTDALGAAAAGMLGVWLDRSGVATDAERAEADAAGVPIIHSLAEVPALLA